MQNRPHRLQILDRELPKEILQDMLGAHACVDYERRGPKEAAFGPSPRMTPVLLAPPCQSPKSPLIVLVPLATFACQLRASITPLAKRKALFPGPFSSG